MAKKSTRHSGGSLTKAARNLSSNNTTKKQKSTAGTILANHKAKAHKK